METCISSEYIVPQGLLQGGTLSPGLWLAYIADLAEDVKETDSDIALSMLRTMSQFWSTLDTLEDCRRQLQEAVNRLGTYLRGERYQDESGENVHSSLYVHQLGSITWLDTKVQVAGCMVGLSESARF